jgi:hypothetical protein
MAAHIKNRPTTLRDHLHRSSSLLEYAIGQTEQLRLLLTTIALSYPTLYVSWLDWATQLASLQHQMEARSQYLLTMATRELNATAGQHLSLRRAYLNCSAGLGGMSDPPAPGTVEPE